MPGQVYEPLTGSPAEETPYLMQCSTRRERGLVIAAAGASLVAGMLLITAVFMHMECESGVLIVVQSRSANVMSSRENGVSAVCSEVEFDLLTFFNAT